MFLHILLLLLTLPTRSLSTPIAIFAHYMVGTLTPTHAESDILLALSLNITAFALNIQHPTAPWTQTTLAHLFASATTHSFKLFFSLDLSPSLSTHHPTAFLPLLHQYLPHPSYYTHNARPFLSTFGGGNFSPQTWTDLFTTLRPSPQPFFVPSFQDEYDTTFFTSHPEIDGVMAWETAWPWNPHERLDERNLNITTQRGKVYMQAVSSYQYKHISDEQNWVRRGGLGLIEGMQRAIELRPAFVQLVSWNDAGEGHWVGEVWEEGITRESAELVRGFERAGWRRLVRMWVGALRGQGWRPEGGRRVEGAFWYRPLRKGAVCVRDGHGLGRPRGLEGERDVVSGAVVLGEGVEGVVRVWSGGVVVGQWRVREGLNVFEAGVGLGKVMVQVLGRDRTVIAEGVGNMDVTDDIGKMGGLLNFNYQVVEIV